MSSVIVEARGLTKTYRLYKKPHYRFLDMFGLLRGSGRYTELSALNSVDLTIKRGEKVAIIGRNGAGKSTFLKLVSGVIEPSAGELVVANKVHALLQIGTGFHPEFTGRENVYSYLAQLGITGKEADEKLQEIVEFAELEEYIEQPIKTYSTGMGVRLMFSTSTAITPEVLVLDEVLGVGDAYFTQKSYERIRDLCDGAGTTLLLVTHDLYAATRICTRFIWIDRGRVLLDSDAETVVNRYEASIRDQEEHRLRKISMRAIRENQQRGADADVNVYFGQIRAQGSTPLDADVPIRSLSFWKGNEKLASIAPGEGDEGDGITLSLKARTGNWSDVREIDGVPVRCFATSGSIYHRAPFVIHSRAFAAAQAPGSDDAGETSEIGGGLSVELECKDTSVTPLVVDVFNAEGARCFRADFDNSGLGDWIKRRIDLRATSRMEVAKPRFNRYGSQMLSITNVVFLDADEQERLCFEVGEPVSIRLHYRINDPTFCEKAVIQVNFLQNGVTRSHRFTLDDELFDFNESDHGVLEVAADPLLLGPGEYLVNVVAMREGGYSREAKTKFFTANENLLDHHSRAYQVVVRPSDNSLVNDVMFLHPVTWRRDGRVVAQGTYGLPDETPGASRDESVAGSIGRLRRALLDVARAAAVAPEAPGVNEEEVAPSADARADDEQHRREAFEEITLLTDIGAGTWTYGALDDEPAARTAARESGFLVHALDTAAEGTIGVAGVWGGLDATGDAEGLLARVERKIAAGGFVVATVPNPDAPQVRRGDGARDREALDALFATAGLRIIDTCAEGANDWRDLAANPLAASLLAGIAEPLRLLERLAGIAPRLRVVACRADEASRFTAAIAQVHARRRQRSYEATLSTRPEPEVDPTAVYLDPPDIEQSGQLFQAEAVPIDAAEIVLSSGIMQIEDARIAVKGTADAPHTYLLRTSDKALEEGVVIVAEGVLRQGGLTVGLLRDDQWASQVTVTSRGPFRVAIQIQQAGAYSIVLANCLSEGALENDFELSRFGVVHGRRPVRS